MSRILRPHAALAPEYLPDCQSVRPAASMLRHMGTYGLPPTHVGSVMLWSSTPRKVSLLTSPGIPAWSRPNAYSGVVSTPRRADPEVLRS